MTNGIVLGKGTTLQQVSDQLKNEPNSDRQLLARTNKHGETVLYARPAAKNVFDKISHFIDRQTGRTDRREERAKNVVLDLVGKVETARQDPGTRNIFDALGNAAEAWAGDRKLNAVSVGHISEAVRTLPAKTDNPIPPGPTFGSLGIARDSNFLKNAESTLADAPNDPDVREEVAHELGAEILDHLLNHSTPEERDAFALSNGFKLMDELGGVLNDMLASRDPPVSLGKVDMEALCRTAFLVAASQVRNDGVLQGAKTPVDIKVPNGQNPDGSVKYKTISKDVPHIEIGGEEYVPTRRLGVGGFGEVYEFVNIKELEKKDSNGGKDSSSKDANVKDINESEGRIAVKISLGLEKMPGMDGVVDNARVYANKLRAAGDEIAMHRGAFGDGCKQVVQLKSHFRMPDGNIAVAMELAPNGDVHSMGKLIDKAVPDKLTRSEADILRLTMLQDMAMGLEHMHSTDGKSGMSHLDFKPGNCFIGSDGTTKLGDFGMSLELEFDDTGNETGKYQDIGHLDNPRYKAPELINSGVTIDATNAKQRADIAGRIASNVKYLKNVFPQGTKESVLKALASNVLEKPIGDIKQRNAEFKAGLRFDNKVDVWGLGMSGVELFSGKTPYEHIDFNSKIEQKIIEFSSNASNEPLSDPVKVKVTVQVPSPPGSKLPPTHKEVDVDEPKPGSVGLKTGNAQIDDLLSRMLRPRADDRDGTTQLLKHAAFKLPGVGTTQARNLIVAMSSGDAQKISDARKALQALTPAPASAISS